MNINSDLRSWVEETEEVQRFVIYLTLSGVWAAFAASIYLYPNQINRIDWIWEFIGFGWSVTALSIAAAALVEKFSNNPAESLFNSALWSFLATVQGLLVFGFLVANNTDAKFSLQGLTDKAVGGLAITMFWSLGVSIFFMAEFFIQIEDLMAENKSSN